MKRINIISKSRARRIALRAAGLHKSQPYGRGLRAAERTISELGYVQIDTISIVQRAHHHIVRSRVPNYTPELINKLQSKRKTIFEYWGHAAAYLPMEHFRFSLPLKQRFRDGKDNWPKADQRTMQSVLKRIEVEGPLMARDFKRTGGMKGTGWWDWKPAKLALERLFFQGDLMVLERRGFQKVYDLPSRILPSQIETRYPSDTEFARYLIFDAMSRYGLVTLAEICYLRRGVKQNVQKVLLEMLESEEVIQLKIKGYDDETYYAPQDVLGKNPRINKRLHILSPFDPLVIQRKRLIKIFDFEYQIECYVPKAKRNFGYFTLPLMYGTEFVGRMDAKADRSSSTLHLLKVHLEDHCTDEVLDVAPWQEALRAFASFNNCEKIRIHDIAPPQLHRLLSNLE